MESQATPRSGRPPDGRERPGEWAVSPWNRHELAAGPQSRPQSQSWPKMSDCTLRDGEQQVGVVFSAADKIALARQLDDAGVPDLEVGTPAMSEEDRDAVEAICSLGLRAHISALTRATKPDIDQAIRCGVGSVRISFPISTRQRKAKIRLDDAEYLSRALGIAEYAKSRGAGVIFSPYDTTRCDLDLLERLLVSFAREGYVDRIRLVDTVGAATPEAIRYLTRFMSDAGGGIPIEVHCHDDFGLAAANTIMAALSGAAYLSTTIAGIGERSGNAALEEVVVALAVLYGIDTGVRLDALPALAEEVTGRTGVAVQPHKAVVGANSFTHESGTVVAGLLADPFTAEAYAPAVVGRSRRITVGKKSGAAAVRFKLEQAGFDTDPEFVEAVLTNVKQRSRAYKRSLTDEEFRALAVRFKGHGGRHD